MPAAVPHVCGLALAHVEGWHAPRLAGDRRKYKRRQPFVDQIGILQNSPPP